MERGTITIRKSLARHSGSGQVYNMFGVSMEEHQQKIGFILKQIFEKSIFLDLNKALQSSKFYSKQTDFDSQGYKQFIEKMIERQLDKVEVFINDTIFGRPEALHWERGIDDRVNKVNTLANQLNQRTKAILERLNNLAIRRAERIYRGRLNQIEERPLQIEEEEEEREDEVGLKLQRQTKTLREYSEGRRGQFLELMIRQ